MAVTSSLEDLIKSGAHFGHQSRRWNPKMEEYLYGVQEGVHVFDLVKTKQALDQGLEMLEQYAKEGKNILLVGTKKQVKDIVEKNAKEAGLFFVIERWLGGTVTNFDHIKKSCTKLTKLKKDLSEGVYSDYTKKERLDLEHEIARLERFFGGIVGMDDLPDLIFIIDIRKESTAIREAKAKDIKTMAIVDSNCDPDEVDYPIPMNDDATRALEYVLGLVKEAVVAGKSKMKNGKKTEEVKSIAKEKSKNKVEDNKNTKGSKSDKNDVKKVIAKKKTDKK